MTTTQTRLYPGMICDGIEFFKTENGLKAINNGSVVNFSEVPKTVREIVQKTIKAEPKANAILEEWFPNDELKQHQKFTECRLGGLDFTPDIINGKLQESEYHDCPLRGQCKAEGILCKALNYKGHTLTHQDIQLMRLLATNDTNEVIAEKLNISYGQFHKVKKSLYIKLGNIQTKQESTRIAMDLNLIKRISANV